jgi:hypothetical protein
MAHAEPQDLFARSNKRLCLGRPARQDGARGSQLFQVGRQWPAGTAVGKLDELGHLPQ